MSTFLHTTLPNGLTILAEPNAEAHTAAVGFFVRTGSRDEDAPVMGVSHFLEHMMFKGTARRSAADVNREFDEMGANYNASTSQEATTYWAHVLPEFLPRTVDLIADMLRPALRESDFDMEKQVILEEIGMYEDHLFWVAYEQAMADAFPDHPLGYRVLGTKDTIAALRRDQMLGYFENRYSPDNIVVSLSGRIDFDREAAMIESLCGPWRRTDATRRYDAAHVTEHDRTIERAGANMHYVIAMAEGPSAQDEDRYAAALLAQIVGDSDGSRLYWSLVDPGLADDAELSHQGYDRTGMFMIHAACAPENAAKVEAILFDTIDRGVDDVTDDEIERARAKMVMDLTLQNERPSGRMMSLGADWLYRGAYAPMQEQIDRLRAVTAVDLRALIERYPMRPRTVVRLTPARG